MKLTLGALGIVLLGTQGFAHGGGRAIDPVLSSLMEFHPGWVTRMVSSHDQTGGNDDGNGNGNAPETVDGIKYQTLFHDKGEGRITRIWMTAGIDDQVPADYQELRIEADGQTIYRGKPLDFFEGKSKWHSPLVMSWDETSGSFLSYLPIPYHHDARVLFRGIPHYFHVTYRQGPGSSTGPSADEISRFMSDRSWVTDIASAGLLTVHSGDALATGPLTLTGLRVSATPTQLLNLNVRIGNQAPVPAAFFFGLGTTGSQVPGQELAEVHSELNDVSIEGDHVTMITRLPIPLQTGESLSFESATGATVAAAFQALRAPVPGVRLDLQYRDQMGPGQPTTMTFYESKVPTQFVSLVEQISGNPPGTREYLEGDEMVRTDQMAYPLELGTGTEDYFNGGWYFINGPFTNPNSGEPRFNVIHPEDDWKQALFEHSLYRHHIFDTIVGRSGVRFGFETGDVGAFTPIHYQTLATAYQFDGLQAVGDPLSISAEGTGRGVTSRVDAEFGESDRTLTVHSTPFLQRISLDCPAGARGLFLVRSYDAAKALDAADIFLDDQYAGTFYESYANPVRRFAQDAAWIDLGADDCRFGISLAVIPLSDWNAIDYSVQFFR